MKTCKTTVLVLLLVLGALLDAGCATKYHSVSFTGGYSDTQLDANTYRVSFRGNGYTPRERVENYLMYRCAELAAEAGYDYFVIIDSNSEARNTKYGGTALIKVFKGEKPADNPNAYNALEVMQYLGPKIKR